MDDLRRARAFDFLHTPNLALIIGPYSPTWKTPLRKAASIISTTCGSGAFPTTVPAAGLRPLRRTGRGPRPRGGEGALHGRITAELIGPRISPSWPTRCYRRTAVLNWQSRALEQV